jgi:hypothetical protein
MEEMKIIKEYEEACKHFRSRGGVTYVMNDLWEKYRSVAINSHIFVGTTNPPDQATDTSVRDSAKSTLPFRFRLVNDLLVEEMKKIVGIYDLDMDHVAPFRTIIPFEQNFRARLKELEEQFSKLAELHPDDPAITRSKEWLPWNKTYDVALGTDANGSISFDNVRDGEASALEDSRTLLDGFRALIYLFDNDLAGVVRTYHQARQGTVENIPFSHLWHLFWPGQEIVTKQANRQVYRVLQVSGGRRSVVPRGRRSGRSTVSDLVIDCFYLDYDGKHVRPVPRSYAIRPYVGELSVTALDVFPLQYLDKTAKSNIIQRGRKFVDIAKVSHRRYKGLNLTGEDFHKLEEVCTAQHVGESFSN